MDKQLFLILQDGLCGYINALGKVVIVPQFGDARDFSEGLARVSIDNQYAYINHKGNTAFLADYDFTWDFKDGHACIGVNAEEGTRWGFIDKSGELVVKPQYEYQSHF